MGWWFNAAYALALLGASPFLVWKAWRTGKYREGWSEKLWGKLPALPDDPLHLWAHAVSVGEVAVLQTFLARFQARFPDWRCLVSTTTQAGMRVAQARLAEHAICYAPWDFTWAVRRAIRRVQPRVLVLTELELWPNWIREADRHHIPVAVINGRLSSGSFRGYRKLKPLLAPTFRRLAAVAAQDELYAERFIELGCRPEAVSVTGSMKFDGLLADRSHPEVRNRAMLWAVGPQDCVWVAGSTQPEEDRVVLEVFARLAADFPQLRCVLVPRHPEHFEAAARWMARCGWSWSRRSQLNSPTASRLLLVDTIGELRFWWGIADLAFVGGSLAKGRGGQNMLEPAAFGAAVAFGPHTWNFRDIVQKLLDQQAACVVRNGRELEQFVRQALSDEHWRRDMGQRARQLVLRHQGAVDRTLDFLCQRLDVLAAAPGRSDNMKF
ncbi:MAG: 3-deoxy-D-manno-octulosonic acid transferase [Pirellulaceae bacterium]|nr:MAG: 3-deoxy-D-manno-octulosonic acid transferase [Pirellulaceae bacterium]